MRLLDAGLRLLGREHEADHVMDEGARWRSSAPIFRPDTATPFRLPCSARLPLRYSRRSNGRDYAAIPAGGGGGAGRLGRRYGCRTPERRLARLLARHGL